MIQWSRSPRGSEGVPSHSQGASPGLQSEAVEEAWPRYLYGAGGPQRTAPRERPHSAGARRWYALPPLGAAPWQLPGTWVESRRTCIRRCRPHRSYTWACCPRIAPFLGQQDGSIPDTVRGEGENAYLPRATIGAGHAAGLASGLFPSASRAQACLVKASARPCPWLRILHCICAI